MLLGVRHVLLNGLWLPGNFAVQQCRRMCVPIHLVTGDAAWPLSIRGTGFLYSIFGRQFCIFTKHQLGRDFEASQVYLKLTDDRDHRTLHGGTCLVEFPKDDDREEYDLCAIEMPWSVEAGPDTRVFFIARDTVPPSCNEADKFFALGYPSTLTQMHGVECSERIEMAQVLVWAECVIESASTLPMLKLLECSEVMSPRCGGNFDGFSGGPVFSVNTRSRAIEFRGIVIRGGRDKLFFASSTWVNKLGQLALQRPRFRMMAA